MKKDITKKLIKNNNSVKKNNIEKVNKELEDTLITKIYRRSEIELISQKISMLGKTKITIGSFLNMRLFLSITAFVMAIFLTDYSYILAPIVAVIVYYGYYYILLINPIDKRAKKLDHEALSFFEILTLTLESGRNLENSLEITIDNIDSELSNEFRQTLLEIKFGKSLIEALEDMKGRIPSETINNIILNMTQTSIFGSNILDTMNNQIDFLRDKQLLEIKEQMNKLPNKISIISVIFIVPLILLLVLGPFLLKFLG